MNIDFKEIFTGKKFIWAVVKDKLKTILNILFTLTFLYLIIFNYMCKFYTKSVECYCKMGMLSMTRALLISMW